MVFVVGEPDRTAVEGNRVAAARQIGHGDGEALA